MERQKTQNMERQKNDSSPLKVWVENADFCKSVVNKIMTTQ